MNAKKNDDARIQEIYDVIELTLEEIAAIGLSQEEFLNPSCAKDNLVADGVANRVLRVTEEAGKLSDEVTAAYDIDRAEISGMRNRLAHAYGEVDMGVIWQIVQEDFPVLLEQCKLYAEDRGMTLGEAW